MESHVILLSGDRGDSDPPLAAAVLVLRDELNAASSTLRDRRGVLVHNFEEQCGRRGGRERAELPLTRAAESHFLLPDARSFHTQGNAGSDRPGNLDLPRRLHLQRRVERHLQVALAVLGEHPLERLFEQRGIERVSHDHVTAGRVAALSHLEEPGLIEGAGVNIDYVAVGRGPRREGIVVLRRFLHVLRVVFLDIVVRSDRVPQIVGHDLTGPLGAGPADEQHDPGSRVGVTGFQQTGGNGQRNAGRSQRTFSRVHGPRIALQFS